MKTRSCGIFSWLIQFDTFLFTLQTTTVPLLLMQCNAGGEHCAISLFDESRGLVE